MVTLLLAMKKAMFSLVCQVYQLHSDGERLRIILVEQMGKFLCETDAASIDLLSKSGIMRIQTHIRQQEHIQAAFFRYDGLYIHEIQSC